MSTSSRLPELGARGGGWVAAQFVLLAAVALSALIGLGWPDRWMPWVAAVSFALMLAGLALLVLGSVELGDALTPFPRPRDGSTLSVGGVYARARHPIYGGAILLAAGWVLIFASVVGAILVVALVVLFELKARREEEWLRGRYGDYDAYRARTRRKFVPWLY
jgi:protein-S-isoprenylcysteine O-methyltransferase Ste14